MVKNKSKISVSHSELEGHNTEFYSKKCATDFFICG